MTIYYSRFTTTDGREFLIGYDSESEGTGDVVVVEVLHPIQPTSFSKDASNWHPNQEQSQHFRDLLELSLP